MDPLILKCFKFLYVHMRLDEDILPLEMCMSYAGLYFNKLPPEMNYRIAVDIFNERRDIKMVLFEFHRRHPSMFRKYLQTMWSIFKTQHAHYDASFFSFIKHVDNLMDTHNSNPLIHIPQVAISILSDRAKDWFNYESVAELISVIHKNNRDVIKLAVKKAPVFRHIKSSMKDDKEIALAAIETFCGQLQFASMRLQDDEELVSIVIDNDPKSLQHASARLRMKDELMLKALRTASNKEDDTILNHTTFFWNDDFEFVMKAVSRNGFNLKYASARLKENRKIVLAAVSEVGDALQYANARSRDDFEIVKAAGQSRNPHFWTELLQFASERLQDNTIIVKIMLKQNWTNFVHASIRLKNNKEIVKYAVQLEGRALSVAGKDMKDDEEIVKIAIQKNSLNMEFASNRLKQCDDIFF